MNDKKNNMSNRFDYIALAVVILLAIGFVLVLVFGGGR